MELILELLLNGLGELILEILGGTRADQRPAGRAFIWLIAGVVLGWASTLVFPAHFINDETLRRVNLALTPLTVGAVSGLVAWGRGRPAASSAVSAMLFSLAFAVARWKLAA